MQSRIVLLSGGMDSSTLLAHVIERWGSSEKIRAISFNYGQRHKKELVAAEVIAEHYHVEHRIADLRHVGEDFMFGSSQTSDHIAVPHGHYTDESMQKTVVPNRNMIMLSIATAWAEATHADTVAYAAHAGDHAIYPDCRPEFVDAIRLSIAKATDDRVRVYTPYIQKTKADILKEGLELKVPYELTWTCYEGKDLACGRCGTCVERLEAFSLLGTKDPLTYLEGATQ